MGSSDLEKRLTGRPARLPRVFTAFECGMNIGSLHAASRAFYRLRIYEAVTVGLTPTRYERGIMF